MNGRGKERKKSDSHQQGINNKREFEHHIQKENANSLELIDMQQHMIETYEKFLKLDDDDQSKILREDNPILNTEWREPHNNKKLMKALYLQHQWYDTPSRLVPRAIAHFACPLSWPYHHMWARSGPQHVHIWSDLSKSVADLCHNLSISVPSPVQISLD
uniref:Uncharacterized protein n=1 Tax=Timema poppense TaxID=170557 RepID=A0A7R9GU02_TIMPO|nr:unnamed protein product [Timema poppensis]